MQNKKIAKRIIYILLIIVIFLPNCEFLRRAEYLKKYQSAANFVKKDIAKRGEEAHLFYLVLCEYGLKKGITGLLRGENYTFIPLVGLGEVLPTYVDSSLCNLKRYTWKKDTLIYINRGKTPTKFYLFQKIYSQKLFERFERGEIICFEIKENEILEPDVVHSRDLITIRVYFENDSPRVTYHIYTPYNITYRAIKAFLEDLAQQMNKATKVGISVVLKLGMLGLLPPNPPFKSGRQIWYGLPTKKKGMLCAVDLWRFPRGVWIEVTNVKIEYDFEGIGHPVANVIMYSCTQIDTFINKEYKICEAEVSEGEIKYIQY